MEDTEPGTKATQSPPEVAEPGTEVTELPAQADEPETSATELPAEAPVPGSPVDPYPSAESSSSADSDSRKPYAQERSLESVHALLDLGRAILVMPGEAFVFFYPAGPEQVINACHAAGFRELHFELIGDELVALEYMRLWRENTEKRTWIRSTHPLVVEYCRALHPDLLPYLTPVITPAMACARYLRHVHATQEVELVYAGLDAPGPTGHDEFAEILSLSQLDRLLAERGTPPGDQPFLLQTVPPERRRYLSTPGGLPLPMLDQERASSRHFRKLRGLYALAGVSRQLRDETSRLGFIDILPFESALAHPALGPREELFWRREIMELVEPPRAESPVIAPPPELDLSVRYERRPSNLPEKEFEEVARTLTEVGDAVNGSYWRQDPGRFAGYVALAETTLQTRPETALGLFHMSRSYSKAIRDATHDALTDLYSYRALVERVEEELGQANRAGSSLALLFVDLDTFKEINDEHGHPIGNEFLREVAQVLSDTIRSTDIAGRFGGDEFVVLLVYSDPMGAVRVAEQIRQRVSQIRVTAPGGEARTTCSIGIAFHAGEERSLLSADDLFAEADASLYIAKAHGGNRVHPVVKEELSR
ncbi:MAG: diguanylate cyclase [Gemmatimonadota bacterium]